MKAIVRQDPARQKDYPTIGELMAVIAELIQNLPPAQRGPAATALLARMHKFNNPRNPRTPPQGGG